MRNVFWGFVLLSLAIVAYAGWALAGAAQLAADAQRGTVASLMDRVDLPHLRRSLARQIVRAYLEQNDKLKRLKGLGQSLAGGLGTSVADSMLEDILTPDNIGRILKDGRFGTEKLHIGPAVQLPKLDADASQGFAIVLNAYFDGLTSFAIPIAHGTDPYVVHLLLDGVTWKLSGLDLPPSLVSKLAREVTERQKQSGLGPAARPLPARAAAAALSRAVQA